MRFHVTIGLACLAVVSALAFLGHSEAGACRARRCHSLCTGTLSTASGRGVRGRLRHRANRQWLSIPQLICRPDAWPVVVAFGVTLVFAGLVTSAGVSVLGLVTGSERDRGWARDVFPHEGARRRARG